MSIGIDIVVIATVAILKSPPRATMRFYLMSFLNTENPTLCATSSIRAPQPPDRHFSVVSNLLSSKRCSAGGCAYRANIAPTPVLLLPSGVPLCHNDVRYAVGYHSPLAHRQSIGSSPSQVRFRTGQLPRQCECSVTCALHNLFPASC